MSDENQKKDKKNKKIYKYKAKKDSGFTDKQVSMQKDIKEKFYKRKSGEKRLGKIFDASPTILSKAGIFFCFVFIYFVFH